MRKDSEVVSREFAKILRSINHFAINWIFLKVYVSIRESVFQVEKNEVHVGFWG